MARLRFPGRPGHRFDRISVQYFADDQVNIADPSLAFLPRFQSGVREFRELTGPSDEENDDFEGFTKKDLKNAERKLKLFLEKENKKKSEIELQQSIIYEDEEMVARTTRLQSYQDKKITGLARSKIKVNRGKSVSIIGGKDVVSDRTLSRKKTKMKQFKKPVVYTEKDRAKFLLEKARQANLLIQQKELKRRLSAAAGTNKAPVRKQFVLPTQSSRSSRVIKPNKRFIEDEVFNSDIVKKSRLEENLDGSFSPRSTPYTSDSSFIDFSSPKSPDFKGFSNKSPGCLDQPLICDGKRNRKPSLKLRLGTDKDSPETFSQFENHFSSDKIPLAKAGGITSPLAAPKLGTSLFSMQGSQFKKASEIQRFGILGLGSSRKQGASIVQKAKLQLNRAALNKSKAALAKSLKAEMKREAKLAHEALLQDLKSPTKEIEQKTEEEKPKKKRKKNCCNVCSEKCGMSMYNGLVVCSACRSFYRKARQKFRSNPDIVFYCTEKTGECKIKPDNKGRCRYCRLKQCLELGFPNPESVKDMLVADPTKPEPDQTASADESKSSDISILSSPLKTPPNQSIRLTGPRIIMEPVRSSSKSCQSKIGFEEELSPLKHLEGTEKKQKKRRAFKELLRTKQEKPETSLSEGEDKLSQTPVIPPALTSPVQGSVEESPSPGAPGPRIKHVCRNAAVVLGKPIARFPEKSELRLSALPTKDKVQLWKKEEQSRAASDESDDDRTLEEIIQKSPESVVIIKKSPPEKTKGQKRLRGVGGLKIYKRKMRCRQCKGCLAPDCGKCRYCLDKPKFGGAGIIKQACLDKPKFGGPNTQKQCCLERRCLNPLMKRNPTTTFITPKDKDSDSNAGSQCGSPEKTDDMSSTAAPEEESAGEGDDSFIPGTENTGSRVQGLQSQSGTLVNENQQIVTMHLDGTTTTRNNSSGSFPVTRSTRPESVREVRLVAPGREVRALDFDDMPNVQLERVSSGRRPGKISSKLMKKPDLYEKMGKNHGNNDGQCYPVSLQNVIPASRQWGGPLSQPVLHPIKVDFKASCDINTVWTYGLTLTMSAAMSVRALCFLCGSAGKHEMIYCNICCEPFHDFCLEEFERPSPEHYDSWCCAKCQYCHVCGRQNHLLQCDRCQNTYHPGCLGPNYPTKPSKRKNIWICTKCVKCKSCGATTPGTHSHATWTYDFSLCFECGQLMDKGNFCPICHKCYKDDDWESKMIQCNMCESWVHSRCEGLTDEMYEILSYLPEDLSFYCRNCHPHGCPEWERTLKQELQTGLESILHTLILTKSAQYILRQDKKGSPLKIKAASHQEHSNHGAELESPKKSDTISPSVRTLKAASESNCDSKDVKDRTCDDTEESDRTSIDKSVETPDCKHDSSECKSVSIGSDTKLSTCDSDKKSGERNTSDSCMGGEGYNGEKEDMADTPQSNCDNETITCPEPMDTQDTVTVNKTGITSVCDNNSVDCDKIETDKPVNEAGVDTQTSNNGTNTVSNGCETSQENTDIKHSSIINCELRVRVVDCLSEGFKLKDQESTIPKDKVIHNENSPKTKCATKQETHQTAKEVSIKTLDVDKSKTNVDTNSNLSPKEKKSDKDTKDKPLKDKKSVHFKLDEGMERRREATPESEVEEEYPMDLMAMAEKMRDGYYKSVALFCEDLLRIIQLYLDDDLETRATRKKAVATTKSIFVKQMEKFFPWFQVKTSRFWYSSKNMPMGMIADATLPPSNDHTYAQWLERTITPLSPQPSPFKKRAATPVKKIFSAMDEDEGDFHTFMEGEDMRRCMFCLQYGDQDPDDAGRLLYCGQDDWCHVNCALWSAEVYEDAEGGLQNMVEAYSRGKMLKCDFCQRNGATVGCNTKGCKANYHFMCARHDKCRLQEDKKVFCKYHVHHVDGEILSRNRFRVIRRVFVETSRVRTVKKSWSKGLAATNIRILSGSCCIESLGRLTDLSDRPKFLQPVDFMSTRIYWSTKDARRRCVYSCRIIEVRPEQMKSPTITIKDMRIVHDDTDPDYVPLSTPELSGVDVGTGHQAAICDKTIDSVVDLTTDTSATLSTVEDVHMTSQENSIKTPLVTSCRTQDKKSVTVRRSSFSGTGLCDREKNEAKSLSSSWPRSNSKKTDSTNQLDLSLLSPKTLKMLNIKDTSKYTSRNSPVPLNGNMDDDDLKLLKIADRLNKAAAKSGKTDSGQSEGRSPSVERYSPSPAGTLLAVYNRSVRSSSVDGIDYHRASRNPSPLASPNPSPLSSRNPSPLSVKLADLPARAFSPPFRMLSRSRSLSVDKEIRLSDSITRGHKRSTGSDLVLPKFSDSLAQRTMTSMLRKPSAISSSLMSPEPIPVHSSSPVRIHVDPDDLKQLTGQSNVNPESMTNVKGDKDNENPTCDTSESGAVYNEATNTKRSSVEDKKVLSANALYRHLDPSISQPVTCDTETSTALSEPGSAQGPEAGENYTDLTGESLTNLDIVLDEDSEIQETIVVMTDSGESLTDEEAIKIVQELIESRNSSEENMQISETADSENLETIENSASNSSDKATALLETENCETMDNGLSAPSDKDVNSSGIADNEICEPKKNSVKENNLTVSSDIDTNTSAESENCDTLDDSLIKNKETTSDNITEPETCDAEQSSSEMNMTSAKKKSEGEDRIVVDGDDGERSDSPFVPKIGDSPESSRLSGVSRNVRINRSLKGTDEADIDDRDTGGGMPGTDSINSQTTHSGSDHDSGKTDRNLNEENTNSNSIEKLKCDTDSKEIIDLTASVQKENVTEEIEDNSYKSIASDIDDDSDLELLCALDNPMESDSEDSADEGNGAIIEESRAKELQNVENAEMSCEETNTNQDEKDQRDEDESNDEIKDEIKDENEDEMDDRRDEMKPTENNVQAEDRSDKDEIDGDECSQVLNPSELKAELKQMFSDTVSDGASVEHNILDCIAVVDTKENTNHSDKQGSDEDFSDIPGDNQSPHSNSESTNAESEMDENSKDDIACNTEPCKLLETTETLESEPQEESQQGKDELIERKRKFNEGTPEKIKTVDKDERSGSEKREVLRGLGLGTCDEVEKIKNSPPKNSSPVKVFEPAKPELRKRRFLKKSPLKIYPLRKSIVSPVRKDDTKNFSKPSSTEHSTESQSSLPVLDPISKRIKEESIAKSCPGDKGPFKCLTCRRLYRTETSYKTHVENCTFYVSSSDDDTNDSDAERKPTVSKCRKMVEFMRNKKHTRLNRETVEEHYKRMLKNCTEISSLNGESSEKASRSSLRKSTINQRLAMEVEEKRIKAALKDEAQKHKDRPSLKSPVGREYRNTRSQSLDTSIDSQDEESGVKKGRRRPPKGVVKHSEAGEKNLGSKPLKSSSLSSERSPAGRVSDRATRRISRDRLRSDHEKENEEINNLNNKEVLSPIKKGRGRPKRISISDQEFSDDMGSPRRSNTRETSLGKRKNELNIDEQLSSTNVKRKCNGLNTGHSDSKQKLKESDLESPNSDIKRGRGRPKKITKSGGNRSSSNIRKEEINSDKKIVKKGRGRPSINENDDASSVTNKGKEIDQLESSGFKRGRGRPTRSSYGKSNESNTSDGKDTEESEPEIEVIDITQDDTGESDNLESQTEEEDMEQEFSDIEVIDDNADADESFESVEDILDPNTGLLVNKSTGETVCPSEKYKDLDDDEADNSVQSDVIAIGELDRTDISDERQDIDNEMLEKSNNSSKDGPVEKNDLKVTGNTGHGSKETSEPMINDSGKKDNPGHSHSQDYTSPQNDKDKSESNDVQRGSSSDNVNMSEREKNSEESIFSTNTVTKTIGEGLPAEDIPKAVLKLLKDGHKVVIKNPKLNKSFLWQKTEKGYLGKVLDSSALDAVEANIPQAGNVEKSAKASAKDKAVDSKEKQKSEENVSSSMKLPRVVPDSIPKSASDILLERKEALSKKIHEKYQGKNVPKTISTSPILTNETDKSAVEKEEKIQKAPSFTPLRAEYMCGVMIDKKKNKTPSPQVHEMLMNSATMANKLIQKTILQRKLVTTSQPGAQTTETKIAPKVSSPQEHLRSILLSPPDSTAPIAASSLLSVGNRDMLNLASVSLSTSSNWKSNVVSSLSGNLFHLTTDQQMLMQQALQPCIQSTPPFPQFANTGLHTLTGAQAALGLSIMQPSSQTPIIQQQQLSSPQAISVSQIPILQHQQLSSPSALPANVTLQAHPNVVNVRAVNPCVHGPPQMATVAIQQVTARIQPQPQMSQITPPRVYNTNQSITSPSFPNPIPVYTVPKPAFPAKISPKIAPKPVSTTGPKSIGQLSTDSSTPATNPLPSPRSMKYEKMKKFLMQSALLPVAKANRRGLEKSIKPVVTLKSTSNGIVKGQFGNLSRKPGYQKRPKEVRAPKEPLRKRWKWKKNRHEEMDGDTAAQPHAIDKASHPIIHPAKEVTSLPAAAVELEIQDSPLTDLAEAENAGSSTDNHNLGHLEFEIVSDDGFTCRADTLDGAWKQVTEKVQDARSAERLKQLSYSGLSSYQMFGLSLPSVMYHVEQLYGANYCRKYKFKYHKHELAEHELELMNPTGCIRTEPYSGRNPFDMFSFLLSRYRMLPNRRTARTQDEEMVLKSSRRATSMDLPMAMRFRKLKEHSKEAVGVYRSGIHGRGLFCKRNIDAGEMIIEYSGELIRNSLTDSREKYYESKGIGCYMFRIDDVDVVDATMKGSAARFINHSCEPNCYSKVITVDNRKHIVIFAMNPITRGEELTYDYKFPIEEVKIPCTCGSRKCRKYLN